MTVVDVTRSVFSGNGPQGNGGDQWALSGSPAGSCCCFGYKWRVELVFGAILREGLVSKPWKALRRWGSTGLRIPPLQFFCECVEHCIVDAEALPCRRGLARQVQQACIHAIETAGQSIAANSKIFDASTEACTTMVPIPGRPIGVLGRCSLPAVSVSPAALASMTLSAPLRIACPQAHPIWWDFWCLRFYISCLTSKIDKVQDHLRDGHEDVLHDMKIVVTHVQHMKMWTFVSTVTLILLIVSLVGDGLFEKNPQRIVQFVFLGWTIHVAAPGVY
jgi:hypothetical protein